MHFPDIPRPSALLFDFDGVLAQSEDTHLNAWVLAAESVCNIKLSQDQLNLLRGQNTATILRSISEFARKSLDRAALFQAKELHLCETADQVKVFPGVADLLSTLVKQALPHAVVSNSRRKFIEGVFAHNKIAPPPLIAAEDVRSPKPAPEPYLRAAQLLKLDLREYSKAWVFEDSFTGIRSAKAASMHPFGIRTHFDDRYLKNAGALVTFADIAEAFEALRRAAVIRSSS
ncbi:MAG: HAD family hydrolase [Oligoflexales bacterium]